jgi:23S rRNA (pseudouridine1915-N3)-methyltransferase
MTIRLVCVGKARDAYIIDGVHEFRQRIRRYAPLEYVELKAAKRPKHLPDAEVRQQECDRIRKALTAHEYVVILDEDGAQYSSQEFAEFLARCQQDGAIKTVTFVTGGATGLTPALLRQAQGVLSLSKMTFPHQLCRLILLEQIYRAYTILAGEPYHKA